MIAILFFPSFQIVLWHSTHRRPNIFEFFCRHPGERRPPRLDVSLTILSKQRKLSAIHFSKAITNYIYFLFILIYRFQKTGSRSFIQIFKCENNLTNFPFASLFLVYVITTTLIDSMISSYPYPILILNKSLSSTLNQLIIVNYTFLVKCSQKFGN